MAKRLRHLPDLPIRLIEGTVCPDHAVGWCSTTSARSRKARLRRATPRRDGAPLVASVLVVGSENDQRTPRSARHGVEWSRSKVASRPPFLCGSPSKYTSVNWRWPRTKEGVATRCSLRWDW